MEGEILSIDTASKIAKLEKENKKIKTQNTRMKKQIGILCNRLDTRNKQVDKAIDKLYLWGEALDSKFQQEMLNILNGGDKCQKNRKKVNNGNKI